MKVKKVNRYYCDFCKKSGCSSGALKRHEQSCTLNPNRICRMCVLMEDTQTPMEKLIAVLPKRDDEPEELLEKRIKPIIENLRALANGCPVCMMAALKQAHLPVYLAQDFKYQEERDKIFSEINASQYQEEMY